MTGPEHYCKAEQKLAEANQMQHDQGPGCGSEELIAEAQVHATLALAAATALRVHDHDAWRTTAVAPAAGAVSDAG